MSHPKGGLGRRGAPPITAKGRGGGVVVPFQNTVSLLVGFDIKRQYSCPNCEHITTVNSLLENTLNCHVTLFFLLKV